MSAPTINQADIDRFGRLASATEDAIALVREIAADPQNPLSDRARAIVADIDLDEDPELIASIAEAIIRFAVIKP